MSKILSLMMKKMMKILCPTKNKKIKPIKNQEKIKKKSFVQKGKPMKSLKMNKTKGKNNKKMKQTNSGI